MMSLTDLVNEALTRIGIAGEIMDFVREYKEVRGILPEYGVIDSFRETIDSLKYKKLEDYCISALKDSQLQDNHGKYRILINHNSPTERLVLIAEEGEPLKYLRLSDGRRDIIACFPDLGMHYQIRERIEKVLGRKLEVRGGGWLLYKNGRISVYGRSVDFGRANHDEVAEILRNYGLEVEVDG
ncbi:hypothetical protein D6745_01195 [Candidatus Woesearchaeota archaeon]|nr:MAG: hypothetical protein D6745_01195 [Candidatus Woesearchaeota archaeon]